MFDENSGLSGIGGRGKTRVSEDFHAQWGQQQSSGKESGTKFPEAFFRISHIFFYVLAAKCIMTNMVINPIAYIIYSMYVVRRKCQSSRSKPRETSYNLQALLSRYMTKCHDNKSLTINIKLSIILSTLTYFSI